MRSQCPREREKRLDAETRRTRRFAEKTIVATLFHRKAETPRTRRFAEKNTGRGA